MRGGETTAHAQLQQQPAATSSLRASGLALLEVGNILQHVAGATVLVGLASCMGSTAQHKEAQHSNSQRSVAKTHPYVLQGDCSSCYTFL